MFRIIIVTQNMLLTQLHIAENSCITAAMKVKLSVPSDAVLGSIIWAGDGTHVLQYCYKNVY